MKLPMKYFLLSCLSSRKELSSYHEMMPLILEKYGDERQANESLVKNHLEALRAVGALSVEDVEEENGSLVFYYQITDYGTSLLKYIKN